MSHRFGISTFLALALLPAAAAQASTVSVQGDVLTYSGGAGANNVRFLYESDKSMRVVERDEDIVAGPGCIVELPRVARCYRWRPIVVDGGAGNDVMDMSRGGKYDSSSSPITQTTNFLGAADKGFASVMRGGDGNDSLIGGSASDLFDGGLGNDTITAGAGTSDTVDYSSRTNPVTVTLGTGNDGEAGEADVVGTDVDNVIGGAGNDKLTGSSIVNQLYGLGGDDIINGVQASDFLYGGDGADTIDGGANEDRIFGEAGNDTLLGNLGLDELAGGDGNDLLQGGDGNDTLDGGAGDDVHDGGNSADTFVTAQTGADTFDGGVNGAGKNQDAIGWTGTVSGISISNDGLANDGPDSDDNVLNVEILNGTDGNDVLAGGILNEALNGFGGDDELRGNGGQDVINGGDGFDQLFAGTDTVTDILDCGAGAFDEASYQLTVDSVTNCETLFGSPAPADPDPDDPFDF